MLLTISAAGFCDTSAASNFTISGRVTDSQGTGQLKISGYVTNEDGTPMKSANVTLAYATLSNATSTSSGDYESCETDADGYYSFLVPQNWSGNTDVTHSGYSFEPQKRYYQQLSTDITNQNFTALRYRNISGNIHSSDGVALQRVCVLYGLPQYQWVNADLQGNYTVSVPYGWSGVISVPGWSDYLTPNSRTYKEVKTDLTGQDFISVPVKTISGHITDIEGLPVDTVIIESEEGCLFANPNGNGEYIMQVPAGWSGDIRAVDELYGALYTPSHRVYTNVTESITNQDFKEIQKCNITGSINGSYLIESDEIKISGNNGAGEAYFSDHNYSLPVPVGWTGNVTISSKFYSFTPSTRSYSDVKSDIANQNYNAVLSGSSISDIKKYPDGTFVTCLPTLVTGGYSGFCYIESFYRMCGIKVTDPRFNSNCTNMSAFISGTLGTDTNGERFINLKDYYLISLFEPLAPFYMPNRAVGGGNFFYDKSTTAGQAGITDGFGLNNIGLLVKTSGKFTFVDEHTFTVDDGSNAVIKCTVPDSVTLDKSWKFVSITGISSCEKDGETTNRLILTRNQNDIQGY